MTYEPVTAESILKRILACFTQVGQSWTLEAELGPNGDVAEVIAPDELALALDDAHQLMEDEE